MTQHLLSRARDGAMDLLAVNHREHELLINLATPECDSLAEELVALRAYGVPHEEIRRLLGLLGLVLELNATEGGGERDLVGQLDGLASAAHAAARSAEGAVTPSVQKLAGILRPALRVIADREAHDDIEIIRSSATVAGVIEACPDELLLGSSLRHELRPTLHDRLVDLIREWRAC